jgi:hypothetical protein
MHSVRMVTIAVLTIVASAGAGPWWVSWNGDTYPENEGWTRTTSAPPALASGWQPLYRLARSMGDLRGLCRESARDDDAGLRRDTCNVVAS